MNGLMQAKGWTLKELSRRSAVPYENLAKYSQGDVEQPRGKTLSKIAGALGVTELDLRYGSETTQILLEMPRKLTKDVQLGENYGKNRVPMISLTELASHQPEQTLHVLWSGEMSVPVDNDVNIRCIAVKVEDNSNAPRFSEGDLLICDPEADLVPGKYVLARVAGHDKAIIRKYRPISVRSGQSNRVELIPTNNDYPIEVIDEDHEGHIIARCIQRIESL